MPGPGKILIWDFDGTLGWRDGMWSGALADLAGRIRPGSGHKAAVFRPHLQSGFPWHDWRTMRRAGASTDEWWAMLRPVMRGAIDAAGGFEPVEVEAMLDGLREEYLRPETWAVFPDSMSALRRASDDGWTQVMLSNHVPELEQILDRLGLMQPFSRIYNSALTGIEKPHAEAFRQILRDHPLAKAFVMIGDSYEADISPAEAEGMRAVLVRKTDPRTERSCANLRFLSEILSAL